MSHERALRAASLLIAAAALWGCASSLPCGPRHQDERIADAMWGSEVLRISARGVQTYRCEAGPDGRKSMKFTGPIADLFDAAGVKIGRHYLGDTGPVWEIGGAKIIGTKLRERPSSHAGAIPELQLAAKSTGGGALAKVVMIERLNTSGGAAPSADDHAIGDVVEVPYSAEYVFYSATR